MNPADILRLAHHADIEVTIAASGNLFVVPASRLTPELRALLVAHKPGLLALLRDAEHTTAELLRAAMRACDHHGDGAEAREQMRADCLATPAHQRADLLDHFNATYAPRPTAHDEPDDMARCTDCRHYRPKRCGNHKAAGLMSPDVSRDLAGMLRRCPGFQPPAGDMQ